MAPLGPLVRLLAQMVIPVVAVLARALPAAYAQALQNAKKAGVDGAPAAAASILRKTVSRSEALQILNLTEKQAVASPEVIQKQYEKFMEANDISKGGSFYLQSKVVRAKEMLEEFQAEERQREREEGSAGAPGTGEGADTDASADKKRKSSQ